MLTEFHIYLQAKLPDMPPGPEIMLGSRTLRTWKIPETTKFVGLPTSFDSVFNDMQGLERMYIELDGSFVWTGGHGSSRWQIDGQLSDLHGKLHTVELHGCVPEESFDRLLTIIGWPDTEVIFQLVQQGLFVDEKQFRQLIWNQ